MTPTGEFSGQTLAGAYQVGELIAAGGMGAVYRAQQLRLKRDVALKLLHPHLVENVGILERFRREALAAASLSHPRILPVLDFHLDSKPPFMVMPLLTGRSLQEVYNQEGPLHWSRMARIAGQVLEALAVAHDAGLVHRDLKPANIYLTSAPGAPDEALLLDFGVAKLKESDEFDRLTRTGELVGTPLFMAPEQARGETIDGRVDLYALGLVSYALITGRVPFPDENPAQLLVAIQTMEPHPILNLVPDIDPSLAAIIHRAVHKDPAQRFQSAPEMRAALLPFASGAAAASAVAARSRRAAQALQAELDAPTEIVGGGPAVEAAPETRGRQGTAMWQGSVEPPAPAAQASSRSKQATAMWQGSVEPPAPASPAPTAFDAPPAPKSAGPKTSHILMGVAILIFVLLLLGGGALYLGYRALAPAPLPQGGVVPIRGLQPPGSSTPGPTPNSPTAPATPAASTEGASDDK